jgi:hypothetical protein
VFSLGAAPGKARGLERLAQEVELGGTPESAVARAMERAVQKYGAQEWSTWEFRAEPVPKTSGAEVFRFAWREGALVRI